MLVVKPLWLAVVVRRWIGGVLLVVMVEGHNFRLLMMTVPNGLDHVLTPQHLVLCRSRGGPGSDFGSGLSGEDCVAVGLMSSSGGVMVEHEVGAVLIVVGVVGMVGVASAAERVLLVELFLLGTSVLKPDLHLHA